jgi:raffinose/stachyose/melibiose transport system permease protein
MSIRFYKLSRSPAIRGWLLCLPALLLFVVFYLGPAIVGFAVSLNEWDGYSSNITFVGLQNYIDLLHNDRFWNSVVVNWIVVIATIIAQMSVALLLALVLSRKARGMRIFRTAAFTPQVLSIAAVGMIWTLIYDPYQGLLNGILQALGLENYRIAWLGNTDTALLAMLWTTTWFYFGFHTLLFMAGLAAIPDEYYDAARLETNHWYHTLWYITLPLLREQLLISFVLIFSGGFGHIMGLFFLMTHGGPAGRTELMGLYMERLGFRAGQVGMASAISILMLVTVLLVVIWPALIISRERLEYS